MTALDKNVQAIAHAALARLRDSSGDTTILPSPATPGGLGLKIRYTGPAAPEAVPTEIASYEMVSQQPADWAGIHRLVI